MATIGTGKDDPRRWVKAAYHLTDAIERGETGPQGQLPTSSQVAAKLGIGEGTVRHAYRELTDMGIIYRVAGRGYFPDLSRQTPLLDSGTGNPELGHDAQLRAENCLPRGLPQQKPRQVLDKEDSRARFRAGEGK